MDTSFGKNLLERMPHFSNQKCGEVFFLSLTRNHPFSVDQYLQGRGTGIYVCMFNIEWGDSVSTDSRLISGSGNATCRVFDLEGNFFTVGYGENYYILKSDYPNGFRKILIIM